MRQAEQLGRLDARSRIQRRSWLALIPLARATPATDAPGSPQASIRDCQMLQVGATGSAGFVTFMKVSTSMRSGHYV